MHETLQRILDFFGNGLCHQIAERSLEAGGVYFSVCARDTGIYMGLAITLIVLLVMYAGVREKPAAMPPVWVIVVGALLIVPMAIDGGATYLGLYTTTNAVRFFTGFLCGTGVAVLASGGLFSFLPQADHEVNAVDNAGKLWTLLVASAALGIAFYLGYPTLGIVSPLLAFTCQWLAFTFISLLILSTTPLWKSDDSAKRRIIFFAGAVVLAVVEMAALSLVAGALGFLMPW